MYPKLNPPEILRTTGGYELGHALYQFAAEFAVLGYLEIARELVGLINKYAPLYREASNEFNSLWLIWGMAETWPEGEKAQVQQSAKWSNVEPDIGMRERISELAEDYERSSWMLAGFKEKEEQVYDETRLRSCVRKLDASTASDDEGGDSYADATTGWMAMDKSSVLLKALEIAAVLRKQGVSHAGEGLPDVDEIMGWIAERLHANQMITYLTQSAKAWELLKDGALAKAIGVKEEKVQELGRKVIETFKTRYEGGVQRSGMWDKSVEELVRIIEHNSVNNPAATSFWNELYAFAEDRDEGRPIKTILKDPLPRNDIAALERRLNISLPVDYKDFLETTNGMDASWSGITTEPPLFPASEVRWTTKEEEYFTDLAADLLPDGFNLLMEIYGDGQWPKVGTPLQIGSEDIFNVWLLPPPKVKEIVSMYLKSRDRSVKMKDSIENAVTSWAGSVREFENLDWCVMTWASGGFASMEAYPSFRAYLVYKVEASESGYDIGDDSEQGCFAYSCR